MTVVQTIRRYQCSGCVSSPEQLCFKKSALGVGCHTHVPGTIVGGVGRILLGFPHGFDRIGLQYGDSDSSLVISIFDSWDNFTLSYGGYTKFSVPIWKYFDDGTGCIIVRGYQPRLNQGFLHVFVDGKRVWRKIKALVITLKDVKKMD